MEVQVGEDGYSYARKNHGLLALVRTEPMSQRIQIKKTGHSRSLCEKVHVVAELVLPVWISFGGV